MDYEFLDVLSSPGDGVNRVILLTHVNKKERPTSIWSIELGTSDLTTCYVCAVSCLDAPPK